MQPWRELARDLAPDGETLVLLQRGHEFLIKAGGFDLMSNEDDGSAKALSTLGLADCARPDARVLVGGLGMGFSVRAALDTLGPRARVDVAELVPAVVAWNRGPLSPLAENPLKDPRTHVLEKDVREILRASPGVYDAVLLDVDNGPDALAHEGNESLYSGAGIQDCRRALRAPGCLAVWSFSKDPKYIKRLEKAGFSARTEKVPASRKGRGRHHVIFVAQPR